MTRVPRTLILIVRYCMPVEKSAALNSVIAAFRVTPSLRDQYAALLWDNSPAPLEVPPEDFVYHHDPQNGGIAGAFNGSTKYAIEHEYPWILLLDQDSELPLEFLDQMAKVASHVDGMLNVAAIAPTVYVKDFLASPHRVLRNRHVPYPKGESGIAPGEAMAINSGTMLRVAHLLEVGGYSPDFQLEYSDWYIFHQLHLAGKKVWRAAGIRFQHEMTVMDYDTLMSVKRYGELLSAEEAFTDLYRGSFEGLMQTLRLLLRAIKQRLRLRDPEYSNLTLSRLMKRLLSTRKSRIAAWEADGEARRKRYAYGESN